MMCQFRSSSSFNYYFTSWSENIQNNCYKLLQHICLCTVHDELNFLIILRLFMCLCWWYHHILHYIHKTSTASLIDIWKASFQRNMFIVWKVLFKILFNIVIKSISWCIKFCYSRSQACCHYKSEVFMHTYSAKEVFKHDWLFKTVYFSLYNNCQISTAL